MLYLVTGGMGAGKTLFTLFWVRALQLSSNRPVCYNPVLKLKGEALTWGWKEAEFDKWQDEPDGTIFITDECHEVMPIRGAGAKAPPDHIKALARHRHRGFDFYLVTQHPKNMDSFVRRLIADPGWHRHVKRRRGADFVAVLEWPNVNEKCESNTAGKTATVSNARYPKEVFEWYESATIHTAKFRFPKQMYYVIGALILVPVLIGGAIYYMQGLKKPATASPQTSSLPTLSFGSQQGSQAAEKHALTAAEYVDQYMPRIPGLAHTAPRYDPLTEPKQVPYPAACVQRKAKDECRCYTQNATPMDVTPDMCKRIVRDGIFLDWQEANNSAGRSWADPPAIAPSQPPELVSRPVQGEPPMGYADRLAQRNASVSSMFGR